MDYACADEIARPILGHGGPIAILIENLRYRNLLEQVTSVVRGNVVDVPLRDSYGVIFCDAVHTEREIDVVGQTLARIARPGTWLVCDDIHGHTNLISALSVHVQFEHLTLLADIDAGNKMAIGRVRRTSLRSSA